MSLKKEIGIATAANWAGSFFAYIIAFFATPIIVSSFGDIRYGIWSLAMSFTAYYGMLDFGISSSIQKFFTQYIEQKDFSLANAIITAAFFLYLCVFCLLMIIVSCLVWKLEVIFNIPSDQVSETKILFIITAVNFGIELVCNTFRSVVLCYRKFVLRNAILTVFSIIKSIGIIVVLKMNYGIIGAGLFVLGIDALRNLVYVFIVLKIAPFFKISFKNLDLKSIKSSYTFTLYNFIRMVSMRLLEKTDLILVGIFFDMRVVTLYSIGESLCRYAKMIPKGVRGTILPFASKLHAQNEMESLQKMGMLLPKYTISFLLGFLLFMGVFGRLVIELWMGPGYDVSWQILMLLLFSQILFMSQSILIHVLIGIGENKFFGYLGIAEAVLKLVTSLIFLRMFDFYGIAVSSIFVFIITSLVITPWYALTKLEIEKTRYYYNVIIKPVFLLSALYLINKNLGDNLWFAPLVGLEYFIVFYLFVWKEVRLSKGKIKFQIS